MAKTDTIFTQMDFTKLFDQFKFPGMEMGSMMESQQRNMQAMIDAQKVAAEAYQSVMKRQVQMIQENMEQVSGAIRELMTQQTPSDAAAKQAEVMRSTLEKTFQDLQEMAEMTTGAHQEAFRIVQERLQENMANLQAVGKKATKG